MDNSQRCKFFKDEKIIGIDPGKSGGISIFSLTKNCLIESIRMPETPLDLLNFFKIYSNNSIAFLEKVGGLPGMGGSPMFNFGAGFGHIQMALLACKIQTEEVTPQKWQKEFQLGTKGKSTTSVWKNKLKAKAQQLYPSVNMNLMISDSILIMEYGRRKIKSNEI